MKLPSSKIQRIGRAFWEESLLKVTFPISTGLLEQAILLTQPVSIVKLNGLSLLEISKYLAGRGNNKCYYPDNKELFGFILSFNGHTLIFLNGTECSREQCFTLAHELSHYLLDFKLPRQLLIKKYGDSIIDALNNKRTFTSEERISAVINGYTLSEFSYILDTPALSSFDRLKVWNSENKADGLAMELLAPFNTILQDIHICNTPKKYSILEKLLPDILQTKYGFTEHIAELYGKSLAYKISGGMSLAEKWNI